jgi:hypothetical protein
MQDAEHGLVDPATPGGQLRAGALCQPVGKHQDLGGVTRRRPERWWWRR